MSSELNQAARVTGPKAAADATMRTGVQRYAVTTSNQQITLPTTGKADKDKTTVNRRWLRMLAKGVNVQWAEGHGSAPTLVYNQAAAVGTGHVAAGATLVDGLPEQVMLSSEVTHLAFIGDATAGFFEFYISDQPFV